MARLDWGSAGAALLAAGVLGPPAAAQTTASPPPTDKVVEEVIVTGAKNLAGVVEAKNSASAFGLDKAIVDTPRSVTAISDQLLDRYNIKSVYDFTAVAAGTYTGSYFGVPGSLNIRGTIADNYFNGFQEITNFANYPTPVDASSNIELVRGPPSPVYSAGQIGGYLNFIPKSALGNDAKYLATPTGEVTATFGSYEQKEFTAEGGTPLNLGGNRAGVYAFVEIIDSGSFYIGDHPQSQTAQLTFNTDIGPAWTFTATAQFINSSGALKDIGWNRVTQALIDNDQYISGQALEKIVTPGAAFITPAAFAAANAKATGGIQQYVLPAYYVFATPNPYTELNPATVKIVNLSPRVTDISADDINNATTPILYLGLTRDLGPFGTLKLESFTQDLNSLNYQSYGFATDFRTFVNEERVTYSVKKDFSDVLQTQTVAGVSYRNTDAHSQGYLNSGVNAQDRWDLSQPQTPDEIFNAVFSTPGRAGYVWDNNIRSIQEDLGVFFVEDALLFNHLDITGGVRDDNYWLHSVDIGPYAAVEGAVQNKLYYNSASPVSYNISASLKNPFAVPYVTYAKSYSLNVDQGGAVDPSLLDSPGSFLGASTLEEVGLKSSQFGGRLYVATDFYRQKNEYLDGRTTAIDAQTGEGFEGELRYLITRYLGLTSTVTLQHVHQDAFGDGSGPFLVITPEQAGIPGVSGYGGQFESNAEFLGLGKGYDLHTTPRASYSLFATYDMKGIWGLTGGVVYNTHTGGSLPGSIQLPAYGLVKAGAYVMVHGVRIDAYVDNLLDQRYFIAEYDVDSNATVLPGVGREFHIKLSKKF